jgi:hypothetical protein
MPLEVAVLRPDLALHSGPLGRLVAMLRDQARQIDDLGNLRRCDHQKWDKHGDFTTETMKKWGFCQGKCEIWRI